MLKDYDDQDHYLRDEDARPIPHRRSIVLDAMSYVLLAAAVALVVIGSWRVWGML